MVQGGIAGRYEMGVPLGRGTGGSVYEAFDPVIGRRVAVKIYHLSSPEDAATAEAHSRFKQSAKATGRLLHPNIVAVFDYGENSETAWLAMDLVEGQSLRCHLDTDGKLPVPEAARLMDQVLSALGYAHARGVVHSDLKPANIMLTRDGSAKVADFGVARLEDSSVTHVGTLIGTPFYMAPEQFRGELVDHRADIWAAGAVLHELLTGEKPFAGSVASVMQKVLFAESPPPSRTAPVPPAFDPVVAKAMAKRPGERFATASEFAEAIRTAAATATTAGRTPSSPPGLPSGGDETIVTSSAARRRPAAASRRPPPARRRDEGRKGVRFGAIAAVGTAVLAALGIGIFSLESGSSRSGSPFPNDGVAAPEASLPKPEPQREALLTPPAEAPGSRLDTQGAVRTEPALAQPSGSVPSVDRSSGPFSAVPPLSGGRALPPSPVVPVFPVPPPDPRPLRPPPAAAQVPAPPPMADWSEVARAVAGAVDCGIVFSESRGGDVTVKGLARSGSEAAVRRMLAERGVPSQASRVEIVPFDGPFCGPLAALRQVAVAPDAAPLVTLLSPTPLAGGQRLRFRVDLPNWPAHLSVIYLAITGDAAHLVRPSSAHPAGSPVILGEEQRWNVVEPFGTDLLVVIASEKPLFAQRRRAAEKISELSGPLSDALRAARESGGRVGASIVAIQTVPQ